MVGEYSGTSEDDVLWIGSERASVWQINDGGGPQTYNRPSVVQAK